MDAKLAADGELSAALGRLNDVLDQSEVEAGATLAELRRQLADCEARLATARQSYTGNRRAR